MLKTSNISFLHVLDPFIGKFHIIIFATIHHSFGHNFFTQISTRPNCKHLQMTHLMLLVFNKVENIMGKMEKMLVTSIFSFSTTTKVVLTIGKEMVLL